MGYGKRLWRSVREEGVFVALQRATHAKGFPSRILFVKHVRLLVMESLNASGAGRKLGDYELRVGKEDMLDDIVECNEEDDKAGLRTVFERFFKAGHLCCIAQHRDGHVIGYVWAFRGAYELLFDERRSGKVVIELPEKVVFFGNAYVRNDYRLKGVFGQLALFRMRQFQEGCRFLIAVDSWNSHSLKSNLRLGYRPIANVIGLSVLGVPMYLYFCEGIRQRVSIGETVVRMPCPPV